MIKTLQNVLKQDREGFDLPRSVQDAIPIRRLWPDGIFQFGSKFSKTIRFTDINYAIASKEDKTSMFLGYSELLNALDTGSATKLTINNKRLNRQDFEQKILLPRQNDYLDGYRAEYNAMLMDKVTDSSNSVVQERYVTLSVHRKSIEEARTFFDRVTADVTTRLNHLDAHSEELDAVERLRVLHDFYRTGEETEFHVDLRSLMRKGHSFKDAVCPDSFEFKKDHFIMGDKFGRVLFLKEYASYIKDSMVNELTALNRTMMLSIDVIPVPTDEAVREMQSRLLGVETNVTNWQRRQNSNNNFSAVVPYDLEQQRKETREMLDDLTTRDQRMMFAVVTLVHLADSKEELDSDTDALQATARKHLCQLATLNWQQADGLVTALPLGLRRIDALRTLTTEALAVLMPFKAQEIRDQGGVYYGQNTISKNLIIANRKELLNGNGFVLGVSGSGKSFTAKEEIVNVALATNDDIIVIDPEKEYGPIIEGLGGEVIDISATSPNHINAMDMEQGYGDGDNPVVLKSEFLLSLCEQLVGSGKLSAKEKSIIDRCTAQCYHEYLRRGLLDGSEKLRGQLRDAAQQGQPDEFGGDCIENTASGGTQWGAEAMLEKARRGKGRPAVTQPEIPVLNSDAEAPKETPNAGEPVRIKTKGMAQGAQPTGSPSGSTGTIQSQIKTKDIYTRRKAPGAETLRQRPSANGGAAVHRDFPPPGQPPPQPLEQGRQRLVREQKKKAAAAQAKGRRRGADSKICPKPDESISTPVQRHFASRPQIHHVPSQAVNGNETPADSTVRKTVSGARPRTKEARSEVKTGRTTRRTIKTAGRTAQKTVKTAGHGAKAAKKGIETAVQAHGRAAQAAGQTAAASAKRTGKAVLSSLRRAAARNLTAALATGGGVVLAVILVLCMAGLVVASPFGIFFSGGDSGSEQTMPEVIREINQEYDNKLENLKTAVVCDALNLSCSRASWPEVLAVYAVKTATDPDNEQEVVTMDDGKKLLLKGIFWDMNELSSFTSTVPGEGGGEDITTLHITVTAKTAGEMADEFGFDDNQRQQLAELLSDEYRELWNSILYGIGAGDAEIVAVALSQVGNVGGQPYWSWYGFPIRVEWCACFVSWCANECGYIDAGVAPKFAGCVQGSQWFKNRGQWQDRSYTPNPGDIIFFDWACFVP